MTPAIYNKFIKFLKEELALSSDSIQTVQKTAQQNLGPLPMILWQYGLVTLEELDRIYDWLETDYII
ncbi:hypothetical protein Sta7437_0815 [Stanieria cyanosphaera PCC 7437]|uniref:DUF2949 domain-containing protein n=1 Tax=Stanieria cyanosphaera (strain ATCC 29371 / PCC 7437) TaxID=111780 RepID=K9XPE7_STAC7|nr:DUF2949 domain-containing protein [Stanieria cyanosphaera]AFZ34403.1 hypothetical protein Sta7437_0815 [Stanieria cyanosphaera PCC 7437]